MPLTAKSPTARSAVAGFESRERQSYIIFMKPEKIVATFNDLEKAQAAKLKLEQAGISARVVDESRLQRMVFLSKPLACDKVLVDEKDFEKARHFLQTIDSQDHVLRHEICCIKCGSPHVNYPHFTRNCLMPTFFEVALSVLGITRHRFYCRNCNYTWPITEKLRPRTDILNWPTAHRGVVKEERG
jgi:hypothetical protein